MELLIFLPVLLMSIVVHEVAHAQVAFWEGDDTAARLGRITLNPISHLDPMGSFIVPLLLYLLPGSFLFGWAKPVPINPRKFRDPKWGEIRVSMAGIVANLILAMLAMLALTILTVIRGTVVGGGLVLPVLAEIAFFTLYINLILAFFNLIPLPPLDGSHVLYHLLPPRLGIRYRELGRYGIGILMLLVFVFPGAIQLLLWPVDVLMGLAAQILGGWT
jgi:Zn-dependent protease